MVPPECTIKEYLQRTGNFQSDIASIVKEKLEQYTVHFRSGGELRQMTFKVVHECKLRIQRDANQTNCPCYKHSQQAKAISNIIYSKQQTAQVSVLSK
ncbi:MAG: hypothetical protein NWE96_12105 [Candidatus Bathyarchaeota archaeon]|nr:hypothetical protein [Candidatus Bathyarchaeota archaeon]